MIIWSEFRYEPLAQEYDVGICASATSCARGLAAHRHKKGYADNKGTIHWDRWHSSPTRKRGLHKLLTLIAVIKLQQHRRAGLPKWKALHEQQTWASREGMQRFKIRFPSIYSDQARQEAIRDMRQRWVPIRSMDMAAYQWMHYKQQEEP